MNNQVFAQVINILAERRRQNEREEERRREAVIAQCPEIGQVMDQRQEAVMKSVYSAFALPVEDDLPQKVDGWNTRIRQLLAAHGYPEDYLEPVFQCPHCEDTGYVGTGKKQLCSCARALYAALLEQDGSFKKEETFETFDPQRFPEDVIDASGETQRGRMLKFRDYCEKYADNLPHPDKKNLLLYGGSGLGKTFLLRCIHARAQQRDIPALCVTANQLIRSARKAIFSQDQEGIDALFDIDLLLIDDLGTEPIIPNISIETIYNLINERQNAGLCTVISTNFSLTDLQKRYTERIMSRLLNQEICQVLRFLGKDIR